MVVPGVLGMGDGADTGGTPWYGSGWVQSSDIHDKVVVPGCLSGDSLQIGGSGVSQWGFTADLVVFWSPQWETLQNWLFSGPHSGKHCRNGLGMVRPVKPRGW